MRSQDSAWTYFGATALAAFLPFASTLHANRYPFATMEVLLLAAACSAAGFAVALVLRSGARWLAALLLGVLGAIAIDLLFEVARSTFWLLGPLTLGSIAAAWWLRMHIAFVVLVVAAVLLGTILLVPPASHASSSHPMVRPSPLTDARSERLPVLLHLILDGHGGIDGVPKDVGGGPLFATWLTDFYVQRGFHVFTGAYSEYADTHEAIANLLNFASDARDRPYVAKGKSKPYELTDSAYLRLLTHLGYRLHVYQSDYMDYCRIPGVSYAACHSYSAHDIGVVHDTSISVFERAQFLVNVQIERSGYIRFLRKLYQPVYARNPALGLPAWELQTSRVGPIPVLPVLQQLESDLRLSTAGHAYVAHLMLPHYPYVLDAECRVRPEIEDWLYAIPILPEEAAHWQRHDLERYLDASRGQRYQRYFEQVRCQQKWLDRLFESLLRSQPSAVIILHGDHGSRIARRPPLNWNDPQLTPDDFGDAYSALFAVRCKNHVPGASAGYRPLQMLLSSLFEVSYSHASGKVYQRQSDGTKRLAEVPHPTLYKTSDTASVGSCIASFHEGSGSQASKSTNALSAVAAGASQIARQARAAGSSEKP